MFKFIKEMAGIIKDEVANTQDCGCGCAPKKMASVDNVNDKSEDCGCCGSILQKTQPANGTGGCSCPSSSK